MAESHELEVNVRLNLADAGAQADQFRKDQQARPIDFNGGGGGAGLGSAARDALDASAVRQAQTAVDASRAGRISSAQTLQQQLGIPAMRAQLEQIEQQRAALGITDDDGRRSRGGVGDRGQLGVLRRYLTPGFALLEGTRIARAVQDRSTALAVAGNDQRAQFQAESAFAENLEATPFVGPVASLVANAFGKSIGGSRAVFNAAQAADERSAQIVKAADYGRQLGQAANLASIVNPVQRRRAEIDFNQQRGRLENESIYRQGTASVDAQFAAERAAREARVSELTSSPAIGDIPEYNRLKRESASEQARRASATARLRQDRDTNDSASQTLADAQRREVDIHEAITRRSIDSSTRANRLYANNRPFEAQIGEIQDENREALLQAQPADRGRVIAQGISRLQRFRADTERQQRNQIEDVGYDTRAREFETRGDSFNAAKQRIIAERQQQQRSVAFGTANEAQLRQEIDLNAFARFQAAAKSETLRERGLDDRVAVTGLQAKGQNAQAQVEEIQRATQLAAAAANAVDRNKILQIGINQEEALRRSLFASRTGNQAESGTFGPGSGLGAMESLEKLPETLTALQQAIDTLNGLLNQP